ncbi:hypothetical protein BKA59DRAFT_431376 [Fusarium tricinctum]|uniref:Extracellular membrane protein CFEM domain-containing protein n=1 Tax=Fusarium tricinctum TaxID=61284 RepID=A0A8K0SFT5_9HYPO|nr:hypothetical protein BKA59DRAFT_431376 [Fusarium tricinctum]
MKTILFALCNVQFCVAETISTSWSCEKGSDVTAFPACNAFLNSGNVCSTVLDRPGKQECLCNQDYLDSIFECEYELQRCFLGNELDSTFDEGIEKWDSLCGSYVTFTPTTPAASAFTDHPDQLCQEVKRACQTAKNLLDECSTYKYDLDTSTFSSCTCQPRLLRQEYSCLYVGNASCLVTEVALSNLPGYSECDNFPSVIGTGLSVVAEATQTSLPELPSGNTKPHTITKTATDPTSTDSSGSQRFFPFPLFTYSSVILLYLILLV